MKKLYLLKSILLLCALVAGSVSAWAEEGDVHDMSITQSTQLNDNASIPTINIDEQDYPVKKVTINYRHNKSITNPVTIEVTVGGTSWGTKNITGNTTADVVFEGESAKGAIVIDFTNNSGSGTGKGTLWVNSVKLTEGAALTPPIATNVVITNPSPLAKGATGTFSATSTEAASCTKTWSSSDASVIDITNASTGAYEAKGRGTATITYTITPTDATNHVEVTEDINVSVTEPVVITASDVVMTYGKPAAIVATTSAGYAGTLGYSSGNTKVATVDADGNVTAVAVGSTTITITAPADAVNLYTAGVDKAINVTVDAPAGGTTAKPAIETVFEETFSDCNSTGGSTSFGTSSNSKIESGKENDYTDNDGWTFTYGYPADKCVKFGSGSYAGSAKSPSLTVVSGKTYTLSFKAAPWSAEASRTITIKVTGGKINDKTSVTTSSMNAGEWNNFEYDIVTNSTSLSLEFSCSANRFFFDEVKLTTGAGTATIPVTLNDYGYATFCSEYPLDFTGATDYSAWYVTGVSGETITFSQITGSIKGGQGILLKGTGSATINIPSADSETMLSGNKLYGTLAPTYAANNQYYGLNDNQFVKVNAGTVKVGKALLPVSGSGARQLTFIFEGTQGISDVEHTAMSTDDAIYSISGQRVSTPKKGLYIVNGKKVVMK